MRYNYSCGVAKRAISDPVTEYGVADLHGRSMRERSRALIGIAHPKFREELEAGARKRKLL